MSRISILYALILGALFCCACTGAGNHKKKLADELRMFRETAILFPNDLLAKRYDGQTPDSSLWDCPLKMVVYVNREGCESCKLMSLLPVYQFALEHKRFKKFGMILILSPSHIESAEEFLAPFRFHYTIFYDLDDSFERLNPHLPKNERFHTFLLDENNKVILIGNPTQNLKLKKLYIKELNKRCL